MNNGLTPFNDLMRDIEHEEIERNAMLEWYRQRIRNAFINNARKPPVIQRNN